MNLRRLLRIVATGVSFTVFGLGCLVFALVIYPFSCLIVPRRNRRRALTRNIITFAFRSFIYMMRDFRLITFEITGLEYIKRNSVIVANHPSLIDVVFLLGWIKDTACVVKGALYDNPLTGGPVRCAGYINNKSPDLLEESLNCLKEGDSLLIFPEGTRSPPGGLHRLLRGPANIALLSGLGISPVTIRMTVSTLTKNRAWWDVPETTPHYRIDIVQSWNLDPYRNSGELQSRQARALTSDLGDFYLQALGQARNIRMDIK